MADLNVKIGELQMKNPVMTASGTFGYGEQVKRARLKKQKQPESWMRMILL